MGSWRMNKKDENGWYQYDEIAKMLVPYLKQNNYTHVELMPLSEHPFDGSWGYQNTGFFAPTKRYGTPDKLMKFVDMMHQAGIGVIMDFVPVHFAVDGYGLKLYDGTPLYEYDNKDTGESEWGSCNFIHSRREVQCFLQSAANYWLEEYHFDGIRMDAVSRLIYWQGDESRGVNDTAIDFLKAFNLGLKQRHPTAMLIAEDSTAYRGVTEPVWKGGLGFDYKWDLGWMHDTLEYFQTGPEYRSRDYHKLTFSMVYFWNERYMLEYCHDEEVRVKNNCFCCEYINCVCVFCPIKWESKVENYMCIDEYKENDSEGIYSICCDETDWREQAKLARKIANLPERQDVQYG